MTTMAIGGPGWIQGLGTSWSSTWVQGPKFSGHPLMFYQAAFRELVWKWVSQHLNNIPFADSDHRADPMTVFLWEESLVVTMRLWESPVKTKVEVEVTQVEINGEPRSQKTPVSKQRQGSIAPWGRRQISQLLITEVCAFWPASSHCWARLRPGTRKSI